MRVPYEWLKEFVDCKLTPDELAKLLTMGGLEVEAIEHMGHEATFLLGVTPNRADCLSISGVAREVAALSGKTFKRELPRPPKGSSRIAKRLNVTLGDRLRCPRYCARIISGVRVGPSPAWMVKRLGAAGYRSINNVVDATNYVMLEMGQPLHAFDAAFLRGNVIVVRCPHQPLSFRTLDDGERKVMTDDLVICDGEGPIALAGIMGGENSEVRQSTTELVLESAFFEAKGIRRTAKRLGLLSESSRRFERGVDPAMTLMALHRLTGLIIEVAGGCPTIDWIDLYSKKFQPQPLRLSTEETNRVLGTKLTTATIIRLIKRLGINVVRQDQRGALLSVPTSRPDLTRPIDLVEEVARLHGYHHIKDDVPRMRACLLQRPKLTPIERQVRQSLVDVGFSETVLMSFVSEERHQAFADIGASPVTITNPLSREQAEMRVTLLPGLLDVANFNRSRQRIDCRIFALGRVYARSVSPGNFEEPRRLAGLMMGGRFPGSWDGAKEQCDFYDAKGAVEMILEKLCLRESAVFQRADDLRFLHPGFSARILCENQRAGFVGLLHPQVASLWDLDPQTFVFELDFERLAERTLAVRPQFQGLSHFPFVERDLAIVVDDRIPVVEIEKAIQDAGISLISDIRLFDLYRGKGVEGGKKSVAYSIRYALSDRTLTDEEVGKAHERLLQSLVEKVGARPRT